MVTGAPLRRRLIRDVQARPSRSALSQLVIGSTAALMAVGVRYALPLPTDQLPTIAVVIMLAVVTTFVGMWAGIATALLGGLLSWYLFFTPSSWSLSHGAAMSLLGFAIVSAVIVTTAQLFRSSERRHHDRELAALQAQADNADLFAREMAHRLKNALAIVQSIAFQTIGGESADAAKFAGRLKALADANELLTEHVQKPTADIADVLDAALNAFRDGSRRIHVESPPAAIPAQQVVSLALAIHELGTNASKYGALSTPAGSVQITVEDMGDRLSVTWKERDGPAVEIPTTHGFGTRLLRRAGMNTDLQFEPDGVRCTIVVRKA